jgi:hypothetical protein
MPKKMTKAEIEAQQDRAIANAERLRALAERAQAQLDRQKRSAQ